MRLRPTSQQFRANDKNQKCRRFHRHLLDGRSVSAPEPRLSPYALADVAILHVGIKLLYVMVL